ncbi:terminase small subunit [Paenibacillus polymyxa]|uniref:terminase small subunit n=1 Tax=Paenibacillus polymyxa TaxID=1406 RepID=UPI001D02025D|nr:terminase small subunit [Paenibacillus polymyxa]
MNIVRKQHIQLDGVGLNAQRVLMEYMKIAFADITDYIEFGQKEEDVLGLEEDPAFDPDTGETKKYRYQHWTGHFNPEPTWSATAKMQ